MALKYLLLGDLGQIGLYLKDYLIENNEEVLGFDIKRSIYEDLRYDDHFISLPGEVIDKINLVDFVVFLAWSVGGAKYLEKHEKTYDFINDNMLIMLNTFSYLKKCNKPFVFVSSQMANIIQSSYGNLKLVGEKYTQSLSGLVVRLWNSYGYEPIGEKSHVIVDLINQAKEKGSIKLITTGSEYRQFLYTRDCCEALYFLSKNYSNIPREKNLHITSFKWTTIIELAEIISCDMNCKWEVGTKKDRIQNLPGERIEPDSYILNYWEPKTSLEEGIRCIIKKMND